MQAKYEIALLASLAGSGFFVAAAIAAPVTPAVAPSLPERAIAALIVPEPFAAVVPEVRQQTEVPQIPVPTEVPYQTYLPRDSFPSVIPGQPAQERTLPRTYYVSIEKVRLDLFQMRLTTEPYCQLPDCTFGSISGELRSGDGGEPRDYRKAVSRALNDPGQAVLERSSEQPARVTLHGGVEAYFVPYFCPLGCGESYIIWDDGDHRYQVGLKKGLQADVVALANSALQNLEREGR